MIQSKWNELGLHCTVLHCNVNRRVERLEYKAKHLFYSNISGVVRTSAPATATLRRTSVPTTTRAPGAGCCRRPTRWSAPPSCPRSRAQETAGDAERRNWFTTVCFYFCVFMKSAKIAWNLTINFKTKWFRTSQVWTRGVGPRAASHLLTMWRCWTVTFVLQPWPETTKQNKKKNKPVHVCR